MGKRHKKMTREDKINYSKALKDKLKMVQCFSVVNASGISRRNINGIEHIIVSSWTLPDDVVMNGILYPADEIEAGYSSLERTLAPIEHPTNSKGEYISASDPEAINNFYAGAYNTNVTRKGGRVHIEKHINVQEALKTDRGKRLLDRINELETSESPRPIHTSVGLFLTIEKLSKPQTNAAGDEYSMIGKDFIFDHDAILLDSIGAATPAQGVGMAINSKGFKIGVERVFLSNAISAATNLPLAPSDTVWSKSAALSRVREKIGAQDAPNSTYGRYHLWFDADNEENYGAYKLPFVDIIDGKAKAIPAALRNAAARLNQTDGPTDAEKTRIRNIIDNYLEKIRTNAMTISYTAMVEQLNQKIKDTIAADWIFIAEVYDDRVIFETGAGFFVVPYTVSGDQVTLAGIPVRVEKMVEYRPIKNQKKGNEIMKQLIINALTKAGIATDGLDDDALLAAYSKLMANKGPEDEDEKGGDGDGDEEGGSEAITNAIKAAIKPLSEKVEALSIQINAGANEKKKDMVTAIINSKKYPGMDEAALNLLPVETLKEMVANCTSAHGLPLTMNEDQKGFSAPAEMPK